MDACAERRRWMDHALSNLVFLNMKLQIFLPHRGIVQSQMEMNLLLVTWEYKRKLIMHCRAYAMERNQVLDSQRTSV